MTDNSSETTDEPHPAAAAGERTGRGLGTAAKLGWMPIDGVLIFVRAMVLGFLAKIPKIGPSLAKGFMTAGYKMRLKNADAIVNVIYEDGVVEPRPAQYQSETTAFETDNGDTFHAKGIGYSPKRLAGKVPVVWALRIGSEITEPLEAAIANSRKLNRFEPFTRQDGSPDVAVDIDPNTIENGPGIGGKTSPARTDGGVSAGAQQAVTVEGTDFAGTIVSFRDGYEQFGTKVDQEEMVRAEERGRLDALDMLGDQGNVRVILYVFGAFALGLLGPSIAARVAGSAGGGGGGGPNIIPLAIDGIGLMQGVVF